MWRRSGGPEPATGSARPLQNPAAEVSWPSRCSRECTGRSRTLLGKRAELEDRPCLRRCGGPDGVVLAEQGTGLRVRRRAPCLRPPGADSVTHARTARAAPVPLRVPGQHFCTLHATGARRGAHLTIIRHAKLAFFLLNQLSNRTSRVPGKQEPVTRGRVFCSRAQSAFLVVGRPHCCSADAGAP